MTEEKKLQFRPMPLVCGVEARFETLHILLEAEGRENKYLREKLANANGMITELQAKLGDARAKLRGAPSYHAI